MTKCLILAMLVIFFMTFCLKTLFYSDMKFFWMTALRIVIGMFTFALLFRKSSPLAQLVRASDC